MNISIVMLCIVFVASNAYAVDNDDVATILRSVSKSINESLPVRVDREKILETTVAISRTLIFKYKVTDSTTFKDTHFVPSKYRSYLKKSLVKSTCKDALPLFERGASYNYIFVDVYGELLFEYTLNKKECVGH